MTIYFRLAGIFFKIALLTFGGGYAMLPLIQAELISSGMTTEAKFADIVGVAEMTPGALAINSATYVGYEQAGIPGALIASIALALPSLTAIVLLAEFVRRVRGGSGGAAVFSLLRPVVAGMVVSAALGLLKIGIMRPGSDLAAGWLAAIEWPAVLMACLACWAAARTRLHPALLMLLCGAAGVLVF